eukprot:366564-Chlamydomonas_euryale.AAC.3
MSCRRGRRDARRSGSSRSQSAAGSGRLHTAGTLGPAPLSATDTPLLLRACNWPGDSSKAPPAPPVQGTTTAAGARRRGAPGATMTMPGGTAGHAARIAAGVGGTYSPLLLALLPLLMLIGLGAGPCCCDGGSSGGGCCCCCCCGSGVCCAYCTSNACSC